MGTIVISTSLSQELWKLAKDNNLMWSEAMRIGLSIMLGDLGIKDYDNNLNLYRKMMLYKRQAEESLQKLSELDSKYQEAKKDGIQN